MTRSDFILKLGTLLADIGQRLILKASFEPGKTAYPLTVAPRAIPFEPMTGVEPFDTAAAQAFNQARLDHLETLDLPLAGKSILDAGCGVGRLSGFFLKKGCTLTALDGRAENIEAFKARHPGVAAHVAKVDEQPLTRFGRFDIVLCYGLLYHLMDPYRALRNLSQVCGELLLLDTVVCDHRLPLARFDDEYLSATEAMHGLGLRPSPSAVAQLLSRAGFQFIYAPKEPPRHKDFQFEWRNNLDFRRDGSLMRCVFVASHKRLGNPKLVSLLG